VGNSHSSTQERGCGGCRHHFSVSCQVSSEMIGLGLGLGLGLRLGVRVRDRNDTTRQQVLSHVLCSFWNILTNWTIFFSSSSFHCCLLCLLFGCCPSC
jgi:hypothetical protein